MNILENPVLARGLAIAAAGVVAGLLLSFGRGIGRLVWKYRQEAAAVPVEELLPAIAMAATPITKVFYAFVVVLSLSRRNLEADALSTGRRRAGCSGVKADQHADGEGGDYRHIPFQVGDVEPGRELGHIRPCRRHNLFRTPFRVRGIIRTVYVTGKF